MRARLGADGPGADFAFSSSIVLSRHWQTPQVLHSHFSARPRGPRVWYGKPGGSEARAKGLKAAPPPFGEGLWSNRAYPGL